MEEWKIRPARDLGLPLGKRLRSLQRENGLVSTGLHLLWWSTIRAYMAAWHCLSITGRQNIPKDPPFILIANHASHLDALVLASPLPSRIRDRIFPIAAGDVFFETPAVAAFAAGMLNALPMWRKKCGPHDLQQLRQRLLEEPSAFILFPEGKRSRDGTMSSFKAGLGVLVAGTSVPVVPCYLDGCFEALRPETNWPRRQRITLHVGEPLVFFDVSNDREGWHYVAKEAEARIRLLGGCSAEQESERVE